MINIKPKAFFFDFDGVIVDSEKFHMLAAFEASQGHGVSFSEEYYFNELLGYDDVGLFEHLWKNGNKNLTRATLKQLMRDKNAAFMQLITSRIIYFDGIVDFIKTLHGANVPLAVVSGALQQEIQTCLTKGGLEGYFRFIISAELVNRSKPDPESYEKAWGDMLVYVPDLKKSECWVIEDSPAGIASAHNAGLNVIGITNSLRGAALNQADHIVDHVREIAIL